MPYVPSLNCKKLIVLLDNAKELSVGHSNRTLAIDSVNSCKILCKSHNFCIDDGIMDVLDSLIYAIRSFNPQVLSDKFDEIEEFVVSCDYSN